MSPRKTSRRTVKSDDESSPETPSVSTLPANSQTQKILFIHEGIGSSAEVECVQLRHPRTSCNALFLMGSDKEQTTHLAELTTFDEGHRSWFLGDTVLSDGKLYIATPFNPIYLILPYLIDAERLVPLDQLLDDDEFPAMTRLAPFAAARLQDVADSKGSADLNVWKYNADKTLAWLTARCRRLAQTLMDKKVPTTTAQALTFVRTMDQQQTKDAYLVLAHGILSDYLPATLSQSLRGSLDLPAFPAKASKSSTGSSDQPPTKKTKTEGPVDDYTLSSPALKKVNPAPTAKARALAKSAVGNKSIMAFFGKK